MHKSVCVSLLKVITLLLLRPLTTNTVDSTVLNKILSATGPFGIQRPKIKQVYKN